MFQNNGTAPQKPSNENDNDKTTQDTQVVSGKHKNHALIMSSESLSPRDYLLCALMTLLFSLCGSVGTALTVLVALPTAALYAAFSCRHSMLFNLTLPFVGFAIALAISRNGYRAVGALFAGLLAFFIFEAVSSHDIRRAKSSTVARCTIALWGYVLLMLLIYSLFHEEFDAGALFAHFFDSMEQSLLSQIDIIFSTPEVAEIAKQTYPDILSSKDSFSEIVSYMVLQIRYLASAVITVAFTALSYLAASLFKLFCNFFGFKEPFKDSPYEITLSSAALLCYFAASLGTLFARGSAYVYFRNISCILSPGFMLCGLKQIGVFFAQKKLPRAFCRTIQVLACLFALFAGNLGVTVLILFGMLYTMNTELRGKNGGNH